MKPTVFISFASEDLQIAKRVKEKLEDANYTVWWQELLQCGHEWHGEIDKALTAANCVVVLWSAKSLGSTWVQHEASRAIARGVYAPVRVDVVDSLEPAEELKVHQAFDRTQAAPLQWKDGDISAGFELLLHRVSDLIPSLPVSVWRWLKYRQWTLIGVTLAAMSAIYLYELNQSLAMQVGEISRIAPRLTQTEQTLSGVLESTKGTQKAMQEVTSDVRNSQQPELRFVYSTTLGSDKPAYLRLENIGTGIARITRVTASFDREKIETDAKTLSEVGACAGFTGYTLKPNEVLAPGSPVTILLREATTLPKDEISPQDRARKALLARLQIEVEYESIFGHRKTKSLEYKNPREPSKSEKIKCLSIGKAASQQ